jgi:hypothetical protein
MDSPRVRKHNTTLEEHLGTRKYLIIIYRQPQNNRLNILIDSPRVRKHNTWKTLGMRKYLIIIYHHRNA